ncbi:ribonuclease E/G [uncultured Anaerococcus sp.]|uniref:ribonuclease E/G n=1 Tax=uncultured Anaerococcus sp. TaxID=293428 RepID=UPI0025EAFA96|nr:ribonuclease E/G [uncultured Anaerococcus sp.]
MFLDLKNNLLTNELEYKLMSIIIDELETMTVVDVNTAAKKSKQRKKDFLLNINLEIIDFIVYNLKLRNIGGMVIIDFLRSGGEDKIRQELKKAIDKYDLEGEIFGFTPMGLFEMTIKRRGDSLRANLEKRNLLS